MSHKQEALRETIHTAGRISEWIITQTEDYPMGQKGSFLIRPFDGKIILKLKGDFNRQNAQWVKKVMTANPCLQKRILELDMQEVDIIDIQAMALISTTLKSLKDRGIATAITGLDSDKRTLAYSLGMHHITQINQE